MGIVKLEIQYLGDGMEVSLLMKQLQIGELAPDFLLSSTKGKKINLSSYLGEKNVLVAFYPLDFTPG